VVQTSAHRKTEGGPSAQNDINRGGPGDRWAALEIAAFSPGLSHGAARLYLALDRYAREPGVCWPKQKVIAARIGCCKRSVQYYLAELIAAGIVEVARMAPGGLNSYVLNHAQQVAPGGAKDCARVAQQVAPYKSNKNNETEQQTEEPPIAPRISSAQNRLTETVAPPAVQQSFLDPEPVAPALAVVPSAPENMDTWFDKKFWPFYPRKVGKAAALTAMHRAAGKSAKLRDEILAGLYRQLPALESRDLQYVPHAATWINQKRWNDEPEAAVRRDAYESPTDRAIRVAEEHIKKYGWL
jgi:hypothetical protein